MKKLIYIVFLGLFILGSCTHKHKEGTRENTHTHAIGDNHTHEEGDEHDHEQEVGHNHEEEGYDHEKESIRSHEDEIILSAAKAEAAGVKCSVIEPAPFRQVIKTSGQISAAQGDESVIVATVSGIVSFHGQITEGMAVNRGKPLVNISSSKTAEGDAAQRALIVHESAKKEYERVKALVESRIVSKKEYEQAKLNHDNAHIAYEALSKNYSPKGQEISSPLGGYVKNILIREGDYVSVGQPLMSVTQNRRLFLRAEVSEKYYSHLRNIRSANFRTPYHNRVYELKQLNGKLLSFGKSSGSQSFYVPVTFEFDNKVDVLPGSFVEVYLLSSDMENVLSLPRTALTEEQGSFFVYLNVDEEGYRKQEVTLGADNGKNVQILSGLKAGDRVVVEGANQVRLAGISTAIPGHTHNH
ncbi:efflux RND transporter periplasmic adaptor subunit [uncultured Bacteroides sp.]|uniref:efflux RND transporter periplasmic adaptor subunit n=1 Tax=uncultured Bacteroides sp. TaxID=162156 RepID=UPI0027DADF5A|nr:efflux RND transporter periplasmic adaptor subunit [uncultured Bacteroides sp.]